MKWQRFNFKYYPIIKYKKKRSLLFMHYLRLIKKFFLKKSKFIFLKSRVYLNFKYLNLKKYKNLFKTPILKKKIYLFKKKILKMKKKKFKNINLFLNKIIFLTLLNFLNFTLKLNKKFYFLNIYKRFCSKRSYKLKLMKKKQLLISIKKNLNSIYSKFKIFNFFKITFLKKLSSLKNSYIDLFFLNRNFLISFSNYFYTKLWSIGLFLKSLRLRYKVKNQIRYIKSFFFKTKFQFTRRIILFLNKISSRFDLFLKNLLFFMKKSNKRIYRKKFIKLTKVIIKLKFKTFEKKQKKKPRKKKYLRKRLKTYIF